ncbi:MAG TPA: hypothetical protein VEK57_22995 [Thermoanaerobaculia bacterium]|nr:hypothetical protein [Thermoanaerobaculia bacterium]
MRFFPGVVSVWLTVLVMASPATPPATQQAGRRWVVDNTAASSGDGTPAYPFLTIAEAVKAAGEGDAIVVSASEKPYRGPVALRDGQSLLGEGGAPTITAEENAVISVHGTSADVIIAGVNVRATGTAAGIDVRKARATVTLRDVTVSTTAGTGLAVAAAAKLVVSGSSSVASVDAPAVTIDGAELDAVFRGISARGERLTNGIALHKTTGRFMVEGIEGTPGSGGTVEGASTRAISAIDASNVTLRGMHVARSAAVNGVAPADCGGNLIDGSNERCHAAVYLRNVAGAALEGVVVDGSGQAGVVAHEVSGLTIAGSTIRNAGDELSEHGLVLEELSGECRISGTAVERSASRHLTLHNSKGRLALVIEKSAFTETSASHGQHGVLVAVAGDAVVDLRVRDSVFTRTFSHGLEVTAQDMASVAVRVTGSTFEKNASAISLVATEAATLGYVIADNPSISGGSGTAINIYLGTPSTGVISGAIARNVIGKSGVARSGAGCDSCSGISLRAGGNGSLIADVTGNVIQQVGGGGIQAVASQGAAEMNLTVTANLLRESSSASAPAIRVQSGALADDQTRVCASLGGSGVNANTIQGAWEPNGAIHLVHRFGRTRFQLAGLTGGKDETAAAGAVAARNGGVKVRAVLRPDSMERGFEPADRCTIPVLTP